METVRKLENTRTFSVFFFKKIAKKSLTKGDGFGILAKLAYGRPKGSTANLENDTEEVNAQYKRIRTRTAESQSRFPRTAREMISEDSKEFSIERCKGLNGRV